MYEGCKLRNCVEKKVNEIEIQNLKVENKIQVYNIIFFKNI